MIFRFFAISLVAFTVVASQGYATYDGDYVNCQASPENTYNGSYAIDFLLSEKVQGAGELLPADYPANPAFWIFLTRTLITPAPEMQKGLQEYFTMLFKEDFSKARVWQKTPFGLPDEQVPESDLTLPSNCGEHANGKVNVKHAIRRSLRGDFIMYEYDAQALEKLKATSSYQYGFVILHSWMKDYAVTPEAIFTLNRLLNSTAIHSWAPSQIYDLLSQLGFLKPASGGVCERDTPVVLELQYRTHKNCSVISNDDLAQVNALEIDWKAYPQYDFRPGDFVSLSGLESLKVQHAFNHLHSVPPAEAKILTHLKRLDLSDNGMGQLPFNFILNLSGLEDVDLSGNEFVQFYKDIFQGLFVQHETGNPVRLKVSSNFNEGYSFGDNNYVYLLPGSFNGLEYVTNLDFSKAHLDRFQSSVFDPLVRLTYLDLSGNVIRNLDQSLRSASLAKVEELDIGGNLFTTLTDSAFSSLTHLHTLKLNDNRLTLFPSFLSGIQSLKELQICNPNWSAELITEAKALFSMARPDLKVSICTATP